MVEGARLESVYAGDRIEGSNPSPSAKSELHRLSHSTMCYGQIFFQKILYIVLILAYNNCSSVIFHLIKGKDEEVCHE